MRFLREFKQNDKGYAEAKLQEIMEASNNFQGDFRFDYSVDDTGFKAELISVADTLFAWMFDFTDSSFFLYHAKEHMDCSIDEALDIIEKDIYRHLGIHENRSIQTFERFIPPPSQIEDKIENLVKELIQQYGGGKEFFDALDDRIKTVNNEDLTLSLVRGCEDKWLVSTGGFGDKLHKLYEEGKIKCRGVLVFNGKIMTKDKGVTYYYPSDFDIEDREFVFVDDSLFSGKTFRVIEDFLKKHNSTIEYISVIYDGSKEKSPKIHSLYRYYDKH